MADVVPDQFGVFGRHQIFEPPPDQFGRLRADQPRELRIGVEDARFPVDQHGFMQAIAELGHRGWRRRLRLRHRGGGTREQMIGNRHQRRKLALIGGQFDAAAKRAAHGDAMELARHFFKRAALATLHRIQHHAPLQATQTTGKIAPGLT